MGEGGCSVILQNDLAVARACGVGAGSIVETHGREAVHSSFAAERGMWLGQTVVHGSAGGSWSVGALTRVAPGSVRP
jgi:hypothetical protein